MKYADLILMPIDQVRSFLLANPGHVAADNALRELESQVKNARKLARQGRKTAVVNGMTKNRFAHKGGRRCPTNHQLG